MNGQQKWIIPVVIGVLFVCVCIAVACATAGGLAWFLRAPVRSQANQAPEVTRVITVEWVEWPTATPQPADSVETPEGGPSLVPEPTTVNAASPRTVEVLKNEPVPMNDPVDLARRLLGKENVPETLSEVPPLYEVGTVMSFWASNLDSNENFEVQATLRYRTKHLYFWVQDGVQYSEQQLRWLCETFETEIYPTNREYFGSEWSPGVDNDPHLYVLFARDLGNSVGGYYSASDEYHPDARKYSNAHEMFMLNADVTSLGSDSIYGTMAHEFQHMIHWYQDRNEDVWVSEGLSTLAQLLNGYQSEGVDRIFVADPDLQLNTWPETSDTIPYYGSSFLFMSYFLDRFGEEALKALVSQPENGLEGVDAVLAARSTIDPLSGKTLNADDFFADWVVANYLNDPEVGDGRYAYRVYARAPRPGDTETVDQCGEDWSERTVNQYGTDYIEIVCSGNYTFTFEGSDEVGVVAEDAYSGTYAFWSNRVSESDTTLTRTFDFTQASGPLTLQYRAWYDIEKDYDFTYLAASVDGKKWEIIQTPFGSGGDITGNNYGWGYTGQSGAWIEESVDLSRFAGQQVQLRFEYITDMAVTNDGFLLDQVRIPEIGYAEDFEESDGGWEGNGFVRIENRLPQNFAITVIRKGTPATVETVWLEAGHSASIPLELGGDVNSAVVVVSGATRFTTQPAQYRFRFEK